MERHSCAHGASASSEIEETNEDVVTSRPASCPYFIESWGTEVSNSENSENAKRGTMLETLATATSKGGMKRMVDNAPIRANMIR